MNNKFYENRIGFLNTKIKTKKKIINLIAVLRFVIFSLFAYLLYKYFSNTQAIFGVFSIISIIIFIGLNVINTYVIYKFKILKELKKINEIEIKSLNLEFDDLPSGSEYISINHNYSSDLDLFGTKSLFQFINRTTTKLGKDKLAFWMKNINISSKEIYLRQSAIKELTKLIEWRQLFKAIGTINNLDSFNLGIVENWLFNNNTFKKNTHLIVYVLSVINIMFITTSLLSYTNIILPIIVSSINLSLVFFQIKKINKEHNKLDKFIKSFVKIIKLIEIIEQQDFKSDKLIELKNKLFDKDNNSKKAFKKINLILNSLDQRGNIIAAVFFNALFLRDIQLVLNIEKWKNNYSSNILDWINIISEIDALNSIANYCFNNDDFIFPSISEKNIICAKQLGHPLIKKEVNVRNDFFIETLHTFKMVTGANMAGKSTFLRTVGINIILASIGSCVCAAQFKFQPVTLFTSMRTSDNLSKETSYFHAELLRLKRLIEISKKEKKVFIILDEILKGTNSVDKLNGSKRFMIKLIDYPISGLIATHDLALGKLEDEYKKNFSNVCFEIEIKGDDILYDYKIKQGISKNMNATKLMENFKLI